MSAYQSLLSFERDRFGGAHAHIVVRDPMWPKGEVVPISPECVWEGELEEQVVRIRRELDKVLKSGRVKFDANKHERTARKQLP